MGQSLLISVYSSLFSIKGRMNRKKYWYLSLGLWGFYWVAFLGLETIFGPNGTVPLTVIIFVAAICLSIRRLHDRDKAGWWLILLLIPILGPTWAFIELGFLIGTPEDNRYGENPLEADYDYLTVKVN